MAGEHPNTKNPSQPTGRKKLIAKQHEWVCWMWYNANAWLVGTATVNKSVRAVRNCIWERQCSHAHTRMVYRLKHVWHWLQRNPAYRSGNSNSLNGISQKSPNTTATCCKKTLRSSRLIWMQLANGLPIWAHCRASWSRKSRTNWMKPAGLITAWRRALLLGAQCAMKR